MAARIPSFSHSLLPLFSGFILVASLFILMFATRQRVPDVDALANQLSAALLCPAGMQLAPVCPSISSGVGTDCNWQCLPTPNPVACTPRPACLDAKPPCMIAEPALGWCPASPVPSAAACPVVTCPANCRVLQPSGKCQVCSCSLSR